MNFRIKLVHMNGFRSPIWGVFAVLMNGKKAQINDDKTYNNGVKVVPSYLLVPVSVDKTNYEKVLVESGYYTADKLK